MNRFIRLLIVLCCSTLHASATLITGRVTDDQGMALSFATVIVKGTTMGTSANDDGYYTLQVPAGSHTISCQYIGYETSQKKIILGADPVTLNFQLSVQALKMAEVVIKQKGEDPAYPIMRKVIAKRKEHADMLRSFETDIYLKGALRIRSTPKKIMGITLDAEQSKELNESLGADSLGRGILYLVEQLSHYVYQAPDKAFNKVQSVRESGDPRGLGFATMPPITNIYENNLQIVSGLNERGFISPANSNAFLYYNFKYMGSFTDGDFLIKKIKVTPKRKYEPLFTGFVYVVDGQWLFQSVELTLTKTAQINVLDTLRLEQYYIPVSKDLWIIQNQILYPTFSLMGIDAVGSFITSYKDQKVNQPIPPSAFENKIIAAYDSAAHDHNEQYWDSIRPIPLAQDEVKDFIKKDSLYQVKKLEEDSLKKVPVYHVGIGAFLLGGPRVKLGKNEWTLRPLITSIGYNTVEGLNGTLYLKWRHRFTEDAYISIDLRNHYGWTSKQYNGLIAATFHTGDPAWKGRSWQFTLQGGRYVYQLNNDRPITAIMNEIYTLFGGLNYMKLYRNTLLQVQAERKFGNGFSANLGLSYEQRAPLANTTLYTFSNNPDPRLSDNQPASLPAFEAHNAGIVQASVSYQPGWKYIQYPDHKQPVHSDAPIMTLNYTKGIPGIGGSKSDFDKWSVSLRDQLRMRLLGNLAYRLEAGGFLNKNYVGIPDWKHLFGNQTILANPYLKSFQLAPYYRFSNTADIYLQGHVEWHLGGWLTNKIPLFRRLNWFLVGGGNALYIGKNDYYAEVFVGLENIGFKMFRFGRVDFVVGYESGLSEPSVGVRVSLGPVLWQLLGINTEQE